jgi:hypothetical protein
MQYRFLEYNVKSNFPSFTQSLLFILVIGPGEYTVSEAAAFTNFATRIEEGSDCVQDPVDLFSRRATGEIQAGETQECIFFNFRD